MSKEHVDFCVDRMARLDHILDRIKEAEDKRDQLSTIPYYHELLNKKQWEPGLFLKVTPRAIYGMKACAEATWKSLRDAGEKDMANAIIREHKQEVIKK